MQVIYSALHLPDFVIPLGLSTLYNGSPVIMPISQQISWEIQGLLLPSAMAQPCRSNHDTHKPPELLHTQFRWTRTSAIDTKQINSPRTNRLS